MIEMTLSSRHRIRNSTPGGLRLSTLPLGHGDSPQYWLSHVDGEETFLFLSAEIGNRTPNSGVKGSGANHYPRAPARFSLLHISLLQTDQLKFWRLKSVPALKELKMYNGLRSRHTMGIQMNMMKQKELSKIFMMILIWFPCFLQK